MRRKNDRLQSKKVHTTETPPAQPKTAAAALARINPFTYGLLGALGVLVALLIGGIVDQLATVLVYIGVAVFLALGLDPVVSFIERKLPRPAAVAIVVSVVVLAFVGIILAIVPLLVEQVTNLIQDGPKMVEDFMASAWFKDVSEQFGSTFDDAAQGVLLSLIHI